MIISFSKHHVHLRLNGGCYNQIKRSQCEKENVQLVQELAEVDGPFESPINVNFRDLIKLELPSLTWNKPDSIPKKMKVTNSGHTVIISGKWKSERPYLTGGPLDGKYVFSQIHFHWGPDNCKGSEHQICGESYPLEMHVAHFKSEYMTQEAALREKDGMVVLVYLFKLQDEPNNSLKKIINTLPCITRTHSCQEIENRSILAFCNPFTDDYFMYWGSVMTSTCAHILLWIVCREPFGISRQQMEGFRKLLDASQQPIMRNSRDPQPLHKRNIFHVNASRHLDEPLLPIKKIMGCFCDRSMGDSDNCRKSDGDGCRCSCSGAQEELEDRKQLDYNQQTGISRDNGMYTQQTVYCHLATVQSITNKSRDLRFLHEDTNVTGRNSTPREEREVSQSCCFLSIDEERSLKEGNSSREKFKDRRRKSFDSVTTLTNLIDTLEALKIQTYKKLKEIENINDEIREMKSSCDNLQEKNWLRQAEKIMARQKRLTIRSSQYCFRELKKLTKEYNLEKLMNDTLLIEPENTKALLFSPTEMADSPFLCSNASGDKNENYESSNLNGLKSGRFSHKSPNLIRSFFEDIKESEEKQVSLEKNLLFKKFGKLSRKSSDHSNMLSLNLQPGNIYITKKMMNMGRIRNQFFSEVPSDEKIISQSETKLVSSGKKKKKKNRNFFKIRFATFENEKPGTNKKAQRSLFKRSALAWLNDRLRTINNSGPIISLRLRDVKENGIVLSKKISKQSLKATSIKKVISDELVRTEVSSYMSESFVSEISEKNSRYSRQSRTRVRNIIREVEKSLETGKKSEMSLIKLIKDMDGNKFFMQMNQTANLSRATSTDAEKRNRKFRSRRSKKELWRKDSLGTFHREYDKVEEDNEIEVNKEERESGIEKRASISTFSSSVTRQHSKRDMTISCQSSKSAMEQLKDIGVDVLEIQNVNSPRRKKSRLDGRKERDNCETDTDKYNNETGKMESYIATYVENNCQADLSQKLSDDDQDSLGKSKPDNQTMMKTFLEISNYSTDVDCQSLNANENEFQTEIQKEQTENVGVQTITDILVEASFPLAYLAEDVSWKEQQMQDTISGNKASEASLSMVTNSDTVNESTNFSYDIPSIPRISMFPEKVETYKVAEVQTVSLVTIQGIAKGEESSQMTDVEKSSQTETATVNSEKSPEIEKIQSEKNETEIINLLTPEENNIAKTSQEELTAYNDFELLTDSNGTMTYNSEKELQSRHSTPSIQSNENEKHDGITRKVALSLTNVHSQQKTLPTGSLNSQLASFDEKQSKRLSCASKKSTSLVRKSSMIMRKLSTIAGSSADFKNLTEEEQLKIISENVANFVKQKLSEHKQIADFCQSENMDFSIEDWCKSANLNIDEGPDDPEEKGKWEKEMKKEEQKPEEMITPPTEIPETSLVEPEKPIIEPQPLTPAGDREKTYKNELRRQPLDFVKLNKVMAGKYKRGMHTDVTGKLSGKKFVKKEPPKTPTAKNTNEASTMKKPDTIKQIPGSLIGRGSRTPSAEGARRRTIPVGKSDIPVLKKRDQSRSPRVPRVTARSASASPKAPITAPITIPAQSLALQKPKPPKKLLVPTYTLTSYLPAPSEFIEYQQRELNRYITPNNDVADFFLSESKNKKYKKKKCLDLSKKDLDYLIMLQKRINHEISSNLENSMNYVQTLLNQDYNGTAIIEKAPVKNSSDLFEPGLEGIVMIEMNDQFDCSSSSSEFSEESGFYCIYQEKNRQDSKYMKPEIIIKREESGDSGLVNSQIFEEVFDTDSNYSCEVSVFVDPEKEKLTQTSDVSDVLKKYIYHLGNGEDSESYSLSNDFLSSDELINPKPQLKKRRDRVLDLSKEMKRKLLDVLEDEMMVPPKPESDANNVVEEKSMSEDLTNQEELESVEVLSKISDMVKLCLNEYDRTQSSDDADDAENCENPREVHS